MLMLTSAAAVAQEWVLALGQASTDADAIAAGLAEALGRPAPATLSFAEFVRCYHWCGC